MDSAERVVTIDERLDAIKNEARDGGTSWDEIRDKCRALAGDDDQLYLTCCKRVGALTIVGNNIVVN